MKYISAYFCTDNRSISLRDLQNLLSGRPALFRSQYREYLYCNSCKGARLLLCETTPPTLRTWKGDTHSPNCNILLAETNINRKQFNDVVINISKNYDDMNKRILMQIQYLKDLDTNPSILSPELVFEPDTVIVRTNPNSRGTIKNERAVYPTRTELMLPFEKEELENARLFFGKVNMSEYINSYGKRCFTLTDLTTNEKICDIQISENVTRFFDTIEDGLYYVGVVGAMKPHNQDGEAPYRLILRTSKLLCLEKCE